MRIESLEYHDKAINWKLRKTFFSDLTLMVGVSGVGKTMILDAIWRLKMIAAGKPANGVEWSVAFSSESGDDYVWTGEYESTGPLEGALWLHQLGFEDDTEKQKILHESLRRNGHIVVERDASSIKFNGEKTPKLSSFESILSILKEEAAVAPASEGFTRVIRSESYKEDDRYSLASPSEFHKLWSEGADLDRILTVELPTMQKAALVYQRHPDLFNQIKEKFIEVFDQVEDVRFEVPAIARPHFWYEYPFLQIKERGIGDWIWFHNISAGMVKTFTHISEMFLWPAGTVVLIDEFENSLGTNCIDALSEELQGTRRLQFIVTSHHPYIINSISPSHWKLVTRKGNVVSAHDVTELEINPASRQKAFLQLINLEEYREGIQPA
jgi:predicted ATPase